MVGPALGELVEVAEERAAERDVEDLAPPADAEQRHAGLDGEPRVVQLDLVELPGWLELLRMRLIPSVAPGLDVAPAREHQAVGSRDRLTSVGGLVKVREQHGEGARREHRTRISDPVVVAVVGEALGDHDERTRPAGRHTRAPTVVSSHVSNMRRP